MNVELPDGTVVQDIPDGISRADLAVKLKANGMAVPDSWLAPADGTVRHTKTRLPGGGWKTETEQLKDVGPVEAALRTAAAAAAPVLKTVNLAVGANVGRIVDGINNFRSGRNDRFYQDAAFAASEEQGGALNEAYGQKQDEEFSPTGKVAGAVLSIPAGMVGGPSAAGINTATDVIDRGGSLEQAAKAGGTSAGVNAALLALPLGAGVKSAQAAGAAGRSALSSAARGAGSAAAVGTGTGIIGRAVENEALPEGQQFDDMRRKPLGGEEITTDAIVSAALGAGAARGAHKQSKAAAKAKADAAPPAFPADKMTDLGDGTYRAPNGSTIDKAAWDASSPRLRDGWMKEVPVEEKAPVGEATEISLTEANKQTGTLPDTTAHDKIIAADPKSEAAKIAKAVKDTAIKQAKAKADATEMRKLAEGTADADLKTALLKRADKLDPPKKVPVGDVKEGMPEIKVPDEKIPVPKVIEGAPEVKTDVPTKPLPVGEAKDLSVDPARPGGPVEPIPVGEVLAAEKPLPVGEAKEYPPGGTFVEKVDPVPVGEAKELPRQHEFDNAPDLPVGEAKELPRGDLTGQAPKAEKPIPVGEAKEVTRSGATPVEKPETIPAGEAKELFVPPEKKGSEHLDLGLPKIEESMLDHAQRAETRKAPAPDDRGRRHIAETLDKGVAEGKLDPDAAATTKWLLDKNPNLARGQRMEINAEKGQGLGSYNSATKVIKIFKGNNANTAPHEFLHAVERLLPEQAQRAVRREWRKSLDAAIAKAKTPAEKDALNHAKRAIEAGTPESVAAVRKAFEDGTLDKAAHYKLTDPSEFFAVNGPRLLAARMNASRSSWVHQTKQFLREFIEHVKGTVGMRSDSPVLKALNHLMNPEKATGKHGGGSDMLVYGETKAMKDATARGESRDIVEPPKAEKRALPEETRLEAIERKLFDRFNRVAKLQKTEAPKSESADVYQADQLYHGRLQDRGDRLEREHIKPIGKALEKAKAAGITVRDADDYLMALHAPERNAVIAQRNPKIQDGGSGLTNKQAQEVIDSFTPEQRKHLDAVADLVHDLNRKKLDAMVDDGLITAGQRDALNKQFKKYVPLKTLEGEEQFTGTGRGYEMRANDITSALGRGSKAGSPIAASVMDASRAAVRGEKARVDRAIWEYGQNKDAQDFVRPYDPDKPPPEVMSRKIGPDGKVKDVVDSQKVQDMTMSLLVNGEDVRVFVPDQGLRDQLRKVATTDPGLLAPIGKATSTVGRLLTEFNPSFTIPNAVKDAITVAVRTKAHGISTAKTLANIPKAWKTIVEHKAGANTPEAQLYKEFLKAGGKTGAYGIQGVADTMRNLEKAGASLGYDDHSAGAMRRLGRALKKVPEAVSGMNEVLEYATRFAVYKEMRANGASPGKAAVAAKEITVNFNRSGEVSRNLNNLFVFANAALQGLRNTAVYSKNPGVRKNMAAMVALGMVVQAWNEHGGGENEETGEPNINSQNDAVADKNVVLLSPGSRSGVKIPLPPEYAALYAIGRRLVRAGTQGQHGREAAGIAGALLDATLPVRAPDADSGTASVAKALTPTLALPPVELLLNQSFFGTPIVPEQHDKKAPQPYFTMSRTGTSDLAKSISELANVGGDRVKPGPLQGALGPLMAPEGIEHLTKAYTGGAGATVMQAKNMVSNAVEGKPTDTNKVPVVNRFAFNEPQSYTSRRYKELAKDFEYAKDYRKAGESEKIEPKIQATLEQYETTEKVLRALFKELREAGASGADREPIQQRIKEEQSRLIKAYNQQSK